MTSNLDNTKRIYPSGTMCIIISENSSINPEPHLPYAWVNTRTNSLMLVLVFYLLPA